MDALTSVEGLVISQQKEWGEIFTGFETRNRYSVSDMTGQQVYVAAEEAGSMILRMFLKALRPFTVVVGTAEGTPILRVKRPFRFYFHQASVEDADGRTLGIIKRRFAMLRRVYSVQDESGKEVFRLFGPLLHPWTFHIQRGRERFGKITKKWSGLFKEGFTDADNFGVTFPGEWPPAVKAIFLGAVFLIDFVHFENKGNN